MPVIKPSVLLGEPQITVVARNRGQITVVANIQVY